MQTLHTNSAFVSFWQFCVPTTALVLQQFTEQEVITVEKLYLWSHFGLLLMPHSPFFPPTASANAICLMFKNKAISKKNYS